VEGSFEHVNKPLGSIKFLSSCVTGGFSRRAQLCEVSYNMYRDIRDRFKPIRRSV
jgi:hypothetical protein